MIRRTFTLGLAAVPVAVPAAAGATAPAPAAKLLSTDTAVLGKPFAIDFFNVTIAKIEWLPDSAPFAQAIQASSDDGNGTLAFTATAKNSSNDSARIPSPTTQAVFKDGSTTEEHALAPFTPAGKALDGEYVPGAGVSVVYALINVPKPTAANPITKLLFRQSYTGLKPEVIRLPDPRVPPVG